MKLAKESFRFLLPLILLSGIAALLSPVWLFPLLGLVGATAFFFRDPVRAIEPSEKDILSPADGTIRSITSLKETPELKTSSQVVSIYLSLLDVHVNRLPVAGQIQRILYQPGRFAMAFREEALTHNENNLIVLKNERITLMVRQIAGWLARRIVCDWKEGDQVRQGERLGIIQFGSCVQLYLPETVSIQVKVGEKVKGGLTVIGTLKGTN